MIDFAELGKRLSISVKESPGNSEQDPELKAYYQKTNGQRVWEIWTQCSVFDEHDRNRMFQTYSGLPDGVVNRYLEVCRQYQEDRATARIKESRKKNGVTAEV
jgi:hypothetical protein